MADARSISKPRFTLLRLDG